CRIASAWGLLFVLAPAVLIGADRLVIDVALAALTVGLLYYGRTPSWKTWMVLAAAALTRETGFFLILAYCLYQVWRREFRIATVFAGAALPAIAWYGYVASLTVSQHYEGSFVPLSAIMHVLAHPAVYPPGTPFATGVVIGDYAALAGALLGFAIALALLIR